MSMRSVIAPLKPALGLWVGPMKPNQAVTSMGYPCHLWICRGRSVSVISALEVAKDKDGIERGPEYHISIAKQTPAGPTRVSAAEAKEVLYEFAPLLDGWEEDNHVPGGVVRNFWRPVADRMVGLECACKGTEALVIEGDFESRPLPGAELHRGRSGQ